LYHFVSREANKPLQCAQQKKQGILQKFDDGICKISYSISSAGLQSTYMYYLGKWSWAQISKD